MTMRLADSLNVMLEECDVREKTGQFGRLEVLIARLLTIRKLFCSF